jgi:hypothetical protein
LKENAIDRKKNISTKPLSDLDRLIER